MKTATGADMNMLSMMKIGVPTVTGYICITMTLHGARNCPDILALLKMVNPKIGSNLPHSFPAMQLFLP